MKSVKKSLLAILLLGTLALNASAGDIQTPGAAAPPPPPPTNVTSSADTTQSSLDPNSGETADTSDDLLFEALAALLYLY